MPDGLMFTYRISAVVKPEIRHELENRSGFRFVATICADIEGLASTWTVHPRSSCTTEFYGRGSSSGGPGEVTRFRPRRWRPRREDLEH